MQFNPAIETNTAAAALWRSVGFGVLTTVREAFAHPTRGVVGLPVTYRRL
jgi:hypothetical protein